MIFGSLNQLNFLVTSRRDDLISLLYMLVYILNQGQLTGIDLESQMANIEAFKQAKKAKESYNIDQLCCKNAIILRDFANEVFSYKFKQCPNYEKLRHILHLAFESKYASNSDTTSSSIEGAEDDENMADETMVQNIQKVPSIIPVNHLRSDNSVIQKVR